MNNSKGVLFLLPDCPGYFTDLCYKMGETLKTKGYTPVFASTSPFYENFKKIDLNEVGKVYYLDVFLEKNIEKGKYEKFPIDHWSYYPSFSRQSYFLGEPLNDINTFKKTKLFFQTIFEENNISLLFSEVVSNSFLYLAHELGVVNNIPFFGILGARIPYHFNVHIDVVGNKVLINKDAPEEYIPINAAPDYMKNSQFGGLFDREYSLVSFSFLKELFQFVFLKHFYSLETRNTKSFLLKYYKTVVKRIVLDFYFSKILKIFQKEVKFETDKIYVTYPLHVYPEASTSVFAKYYDGNEFNLIKNIAFSLPENAVLVVKEHKNNVGTNSRLFYKRIMQLPNVILLDPYFNLRDNIGNFDLVITLSGTVGFEALTKGVPTYVLGEVFYQKYPQVEKIISYFELEEKLKKIKKKSAAIDTQQPYNIYSKICFPGSFNYMSPSCLNEENLLLLLKPMLDYLETGNLATQINN